MLDQPENRYQITVKDLAMSNAYQLEALINVLEKKGMLTSDEALEELANVVEKQRKRKRMN